MAQRKNKTETDPLDPRSFLHHPHDKYVRFVLQSRHIAIELIKYALPSHLFENIDMNSVELSEDTFIDEKLRGHYSDICYSASTLQGEPLRISIIFEHKSNLPDTPVREQLLRYISGAWAKDLKQNRRLSLIIPILVYHGEAPIEKETNETLFPDAPVDLLPFVPAFDYVLLDIARIPDHIIEALEFRILTNIFLALKYGRNADYVQLNWKKILIFAPEVVQDSQSLDIFKATVLYMSTISLTFNEKIQDMNTALTETEQNIVKPYIVQLYEEGIEKGIEKDKIEVVLAAHRKGLSVTLIAEIVNLSESKVDAIIADHKKAK